MNHSWDEFDPVELIKQPIARWLPYKSWKKKWHLIIDHHMRHVEGCHLRLNQQTSGKSQMPFFEATTQRSSTNKSSFQIRLVLEKKLWRIQSSKVQETAIKNVNRWEEFNNGQRNAKHPECMLVFNWSSLINRLSMTLVLRPLSKIP